MGARLWAVALIHILVAAGLVLTGAAAAAQNALVVPLNSVAHAQSVAEFQRDLNREFSDPKESPLAAVARRAFRALPYSQ